MKKIVILGSTGSIGRQTLDIVRAFPGEFEVVGLAAGNNIDLLKEQMAEFNPKHVCCIKPLDSLPDGVTFTPMAEMVALDHIDQVMVATMGSVGLVPTLSALKHGKAVALSNKEPIVMAGSILKDYEKKYGGVILPVDSEPSAIWQCLRGEDNPIRRLMITASGGPFRTTPLEDLTEVTPEKALKHPTWQMGRKITIDSATLMNKALEIIEARWLFDLPPEQIEVVVHPQSIIHSLVEYRDGSTICQLGPPDMRVPIQYALTYPRRLPLPTEQLSLAELGQLTFESPDTERFPALRLAYEVLEQGGTAATVFNAANEVAVAAFLKEEIPFLGILKVVETCLKQHNVVENPALENIFAADEWARLETEKILELECKESS